MDGSLPSAQDLLGAPPATSAPSAQDLLGPPPTANTLQGGSNPAVDNAVAQGPIGRILDAFGQGAKAGLGTTPLGIDDQTAAELRRIGLFNDYAAGQNSLIRAFNEALLRPAAVGLDFAFQRAPMALYRGTQEALIAAGVRPELTAMPEAFMGSPDFAGIPKPPVAAALDQARDVGVIGEGQEGWLGKETPLPPVAEAARAAPLAESTEPPPEAATASILTRAPEALEPEAPAPSEATPVAAPPSPAASAPSSEESAAPIPSILGPIENGQDELAAIAPASEPTTEPASIAADMGPRETLSGPAPSSPDLAGNIRLDLLNTPDDVDAVIRQVADENDNFLDQRRGVVSDGDVLQLADALGMDADQLNTRQIGQAFNAEQVMAARQLLIQSATAVRNAMAKAAEGSDDDVLAYAEAKARHQMIQGQVSGVTAEAGRALRAFRNLNTDDADSLGDFLASTSGKTIADLREEAKLGSTLDTAEKVSKFVNDTKDPTLRDVVQYIYLNGLISGPITHMTYSAGNFLQALWHAVPEKAVTAGLGALHGGERTYLGEVPASLYGMLKGARDGVPAAIKAFKNNVAMPLPGEEAMPPRPVPIKGALGTAIGIPGRSVAAIHSFFRSIAYEQKIQELACRSAASQGLDRGAFPGAVADFVKSPPVDAMREARDFANAQVYMKRPEIGSAMYHAEKFVDAHLWSKVLVPFMRIANNMIEQAYVERSPIGLLTRDVRGRFIGNAGKIAADEQRAKLMVGTALGLGIMSLAAEDLITGPGPKDAEQRRAWLLTHQPYSARIGGTWVPYKRLGALGMLVGGYANLWDAGRAYGSDGLGSAAMALIHGTASNVLDETWMSGLSDFMNAIEHPEEAKGYAGQLLSGFIPYSSALRQTANFIDPYARETRTVPEMLENIVPGLSERLMPRRDVWGDPIPRSQDIFSALGSAVTGQQRISQSPLNLELQRLGVAPAPMRPEVRGVSLTDQQWDDMQRVGGRFARMRVGAIVGMPGYQGIPDPLKQKIIRSAIDDSHEAARALTMMQNPDVLTQAVRNKTAKLGLPSVGVGAAAP